MTRFERREDIIKFCVNNFNFAEDVIFYFNSSRAIEEIENHLEIIFSGEKLIKLISLAKRIILREVKPEEYGEMNANLVLLSNLVAVTVYDYGYIKSLSTAINFFEIEDKGF